jgi:hypothetical protein
VVKCVMWVLWVFALWGVGSCSSLSKKTELTRDRLEAEGVLESKATKPVFWSQWEPQDQFSLRAIVPPKTPCPEIEHFSKKQKMKIRAEASKDFPVRLCEWGASISEVRNVWFEGQPIAIPHKGPKKIAIVGDTGCRVRVATGYRNIQACNDPKAWPFAQVMRSIESYQPDLIIHTGDYLYRESPCPPDEPLCQGEAGFGDVWDVWKSDFFEPSAGALSQAPWIFLRGNHENCARGGQGWMRFFHSGPQASICQAQTEPYKVSLELLDFLVFDSSHADDLLQSKESAVLWSREIQKLRELKPRQPAWLLTHRPLFYEEKRLHKAPGLSHQDHINGTLHAAMDLVPLPSEIQWSVSGHVHVFDLLTFEDNTGPSQLVVGNGGTSLGVAGESIKGKVIHGRKVAQSFPKKDFGFFTMEWDVIQKSWTAKPRGVDGTPVYDCVLEGKKAECRLPTL